MSEPEPRRTVWSRPERGARGPAPERSRRQITAAAIALADAEGLAAVSMRALAQSLGTGPASLYRYVASRHDLLDLMADAVAGEIDLTAAPSGDWVGDLVGLALQAKAAYVRHPWLLDLAQQGSAIGPHAIDYLDHALAVLAQAPGSSQQKLETIGLVGGLATLFARQQVTATTTPPAQAAYLADVAAEGRHPHLLAALATAGPPPSDSPADWDALFARLLGRLLPGLLS
ncbi:transcriptional regulator, TetR family [Streptomyces sp. 2323.1]|uniref:TetR/AcrR family transcriptional regulator n=1 Tax=Streptomyces sp. 2323.1 TaxID=1938841 RepID=UPI000BB91D0A|nr:TetR/AcrR family transcriptional regulator C-terminal domain-containing protein [Streptomyces sp. 2323.1]SOE16125.1 transcriptional regulator, TetR family [Streptomyces sp. 2323.1]